VCLEPAGDHAYSDMLSYLPKLVAHTLQELYKGPSGLENLSATTNMLCEICKKSLTA